jgi:hypothetical protein
MNRHHAFGLLAALTLLACGGPGQRPQGAVPAPPVTRIFVQNHTFATVDVFIVYHDQKFRAGQVFGGSSTTLTMPPFVEPNGSVQVLADPLGTTSAYLSNPVAYLGSEDFRLTIQEQLDLSSFIPQARLP